MTVHTEDFNGTFAWVIDPEANELELWERKGLLRVR